MHRMVFGIHCTVYFRIMMIFTLMMVFGCGSSAMWYKPDHNQVDFDLDDRECRIIAEEMGRQATITGERSDPDVYATAYTNCLFSRGWTRTPPGTESLPEKDRLQAGETKSAEPAVALAGIDGQQLYVFGETIQLPDGFRVVSNQISGFQDVRQQHLVLVEDGPVVLNLVVQQTLSRQFEPIDYPVSQPFFVFDRGQEKLAGKKQLNWAVFAGDFNGDWMAGAGAFYHVSKDSRINMVFTTRIPFPNHPPPAGLRLTPPQKQAVVSFSNQWLEYLHHFQGSGADDL